MPTASVTTACVLLACVSGCVTPPKHDAATGAAAGADATSAEARIAKPALPLVNRPPSPAAGSIAAQRDTLGRTPTASSAKAFTAARQGTFARREAGPTRWPGPAGRRGVDAPPPRPPREHDPNSVVRVTSQVLKPAGRDLEVDWADVAVDGAGVVHVAYRHRPTDRDAWQIAYTRSADGGRTWSEPMVLAEAGPDRPRIDARGAFVVAAWKDEDDLRVACSGDYGTTWTPASTVHESKTRLWAADVAVTAAGRVIAVFTEGQQVLALAGRLGGPLTAPIPIGANGWIPVVAANDQGDVLAAWNNDPIQADSPLDVDIWMSRSRDSGRTWHGPEAVCESPASAFGMPALALEGRTAVLGYHRYPDGQPAVVEIRRSADAGVSWARSQRVARLPKSALGPAVAVADDGGVTVTWAEKRDELFELLAARSVDDGLAFRRPARVSSRLGSTAPRLARGGGFMAYVWSDRETAVPHELLCHVDSEPP